MSKLKVKPAKSSSPFDMSSHKTERTSVAILMYWMREIIKNENLDLGMPDVETAGKDRKMPDAVIYESPGSKKILCLIEAKPPYFDVFDENELKEPARKKATNRKAKYFALTNFKKLIWFNTEKVNSLKNEEEQIVEKYSLSTLEDLNDIQLTRYAEPIKKDLKEFLKKLYSVSSGKEPEPKLAIDEFLVFRLQEKINVLATYYRRIIDDRCHKDSSFRKELTKWFLEQGWSFSGTLQDIDKASRQTAYLLVNKILFYNLLQAKRPQELPPLNIPGGFVRGKHLRKVLQIYFDEVLDIDYETIYTADFIDTVAFPEAKEVIKEIEELISVLRRYDFSKLGYDIIGRIFERLIPQDERHNLGQYFTNADVVDLILRFCLNHEDDKILDPACGAGTFLVRAYQHKKIMNDRLEHEKILETLWGNDIAKFPAHLSTINLAIRDLGVDKNYPNILKEDFFALLVSKKGFDLPEKYIKRLTVGLGEEKREVTYPRKFDAIVGNPPYTRQEEIPEIGVNKEKLIEDALNFDDKKIANISKRAGIHAYFFVHGTKLLKDEGYFGFIVSNSWLDVDYGKGLQEFFLNNYKIIAIIESKVERWFEEADVNTCIIILQKCDAKDAREENIARFVYLKKRLRYFIPSAQNTWDNQVERLNAIDKLKRTILAHNEFYENDELRIFPKTQKELWNEGFEEESKIYIGAKWGKYLRAPEIFFEILKKGKDKLVALKEVADVRFGIKTGANEFFYLTEEEIEQRGIEKEFWMHKDYKGNWIPNYVIKSPRECDSIVVKPEDLKYRVLMIHKDTKDLKNKYVLKYIAEGERRGFDRRPTCAGRKRWYDLGRQKPPDGVWFKAFNDRFLAPRNIGKFFSSDRFYAIYLKNKSLKNILFLYLNSTLSVLITELSGRVNLGEGALDNMTYEAASMLVLDVRKKFKVDVSIFKELMNRPIESIFLETGAFFPEDVSLESVKPDRRELDKIIMGEILGLTDEEQLEVYRAVVDLVRSRLDRAKSVDNNKVMEGINVDSFKNVVIEQIDRETSK